MTNFATLFRRIAMPKERNKADSYREKAYEGDTKAMNNLGVCYERGTGVKVSLELAFEWYMKAAEQGDGVEKNLEECVFWYELAANGGDAQAQFATGWFLMTGTGVPKDERKGLKWIHKATFQGFQPAIDYCKEHGYKWY